MKNITEILELLSNDELFDIEINDIDNDTFVIKVSLRSERKNFEDWVNKLDDDIFTETWESLSEEFGLKTLNDIYNSENYPEVINIFKRKAKEITDKKINRLQELFK